VQRSTRTIASDDARSVVCVSACVSVCLCGWGTPVTCAKRLHRSRCRLGADSCLRRGFRSDECIRRRRGDKTTMRPFAKLLLINSAKRVPSDERILKEDYNGKRTLKTAAWKSMRSLTTATTSLICAIASTPSG